MRFMMASIAFGVSKSSASTARTVACVTDNLNKAQQDGRQKKHTFNSKSVCYLSVDMRSFIPGICISAHYAQVKLTQNIICLFIKEVTKHFICWLILISKNYICLNVFWLSIFFKNYFQHSSSMESPTVPIKSFPVYLGTAGDPACRPGHYGWSLRWRRA